MNFVISTRTLFVALLSLSLLWLLSQVSEIILIFFISLILSFALLPLIERLEKRGFSRPISTTIVYLSVVLIFLGVLGTGISPMVEQTTSFFSQLPKLISSVFSNPAISPYSRQVVEESTRQLATVSVNLVKITLGIFDSFLALITIIVFSFYFSLWYEKLRKLVVKNFTDGTQRKINEALSEVERRIGAWVRGEFILIVVIASFSYLGLSLLRLNYALPLSLIAGVLEVVPVIGPIVSAIPAVVVGFATSPALGFGVLALYILIQQLENNLIVPRVMEKTVGLNPLLTMSAIFIGGRVFGIIGALLAVPVVLILQVIIRVFVLEKR